MHQLDPRESHAPGAHLPRPLIQSVFHPSGFSEATESAFAHALAISLLRQARLTILHAGPERRNRIYPARVPAVRATLERWKLLEPGSPRSAVFQELGLQVQKFAMPSRDPVTTTLEYLDREPSDLMVLATQGRDRPPRWVRCSTAVRLARQSRTMSLFVPSGARGFVAVEDGRLSLRRILIPVDHHPSARAAIQFATRAASVMGDDCVDITVLHVGDSNPIADLTLPEDPRWSWNLLERRGDLLEEISATVDEIRPDLIAMVTEGREEVPNAMRDSIAEQVLRESTCPMLAVPAA